ERCNDNGTIDQIFIESLCNRCLNRANDPDCRIAVHDGSEPTAPARVQSLDWEKDPLLFRCEVTGIRGGLGRDPNQQQAPPAGSGPPALRSPSEGVAAPEPLHGSRSTDRLKRTGNSERRSWRRRASRSRVCTLGIRGPW